MPQSGDILVERLTGRRVMVIEASDKLTCRFDDGRLEDRFAFEVESVPTLFGFGTLISAVLAPLLGRGRGRGTSTRDRERQDDRQIDRRPPL